MDLGIRALRYSGGPCGGSPTICWGGGIVVSREVVGGNGDCVLVRDASAEVAEAGVLCEKQVPKSFNSASRFLDSLAMQNFIAVSTCWRASGLVVSGLGVSGWILAFLAAGDKFMVSRK